MTDELDRILSSDDSLEPSSGFAGAVMGAVRRHAAEPPPIPFPWPRFTIGLVACATMAAAGAALVPRIEPMALDLVAPLASVGSELGYAGLAVIVSVGLARLPGVFARL
jgi:hypothetical protein